MHVLILILIKASALFSTSWALSFLTG